MVSARRQGVRRARLRTNPTSAGLTITTLRGSAESTLPFNSSHAADSACWWRTQTATEAECVWRPEGGQARRGDAEHKRSPPASLQLYVSPVYCVKSASPTLLPSSSSTSVNETQ